uniref:ATP synthase complex subunit 8 n=1 Tax=Lepidoblepharon ophthalmolepis TaxID=195621 RepID=A0A090AKI2_9PLEU|nr:ATP synthase F0 subunit 8 [Lepidoblepharon ophthalmolepis]BAP58968.1 ATPase subunit 8 [Lepidoblepharon ophthalmolepis]
MPQLNTQVWLPTLLLVWTTLLLVITLITTSRHPNKIVKKDKNPTPNTSANQNLPNWPW